jgi:thiol:disulfide interchange protein DsbD
MRRLIFVVISLLATTLFAGNAIAASPGNDAFTAAVQRGPFYAALAALVGGMLVSLTPCVYPMIAITVSVFGARDSRSRWEGIALSAAFVAGIVAMFVPLGVAAGLTGSLFGAVLQSRAVLVGVSLLFATMAVSMFGAFELALPSALTNRLAGVGGIGFRGAFVLGLVCGLIASPCTGPVLTGILTYIAATQSALLGAGAMAAFALGLGLPFFLVGAFAVQLPKSGQWMVKIKSVLGIVLLVVALYYLSLAFPALDRLASRDPLRLAFAGATAVGGLVLGAVHLDVSHRGRLTAVRKGLAVVLASAGVALFAFGLAKPTRHLTWIQSEWSAVEASALVQRRPMLVDFTASWCGACKELERNTFSTPEVADEAARFVALRVDATDDEAPSVVAAMKRHHVLGLPTVVLIGSDGVEQGRFTDFVTADVLVTAMRGVR